MSTIGTSLSGIHASMAQMAASASNVANAASPGYQPVRAVQSETPSGGVSTRIEASGAPQVDLTNEMVSALIAKISSQANVHLLAASHNLSRGLVDRSA
ncbi:hypothetical protein [Sphingobium nicotianae]|uniref:Flagellar basal body rod protein n=1 Tax=Sphingobium nicotianae TaxID=2782607 RepID=A0A9X1DDI3_9SPHN|nr:hypothetical protein [Sphingobium nicotianae]MBT2187914.1 hypothetical protein [Sphingobium nicotianae]